MRRAPERINVSIQKLHTVDQLIQTLAPGTGDSGNVTAALNRILAAAQEHFGLPERPLVHWDRISHRLPWRAPENAAPSPQALVSGDR